MKREISKYLRHLLYLFFFLFSGIQFDVGADDAGFYSEQTFSNFLFATYFYENKEYDKAEEYYGLILKANPELDYVTLKLAQAMIHQKKTDKAFNLLLPLSEKEGDYRCEVDVLLASLSLVQQNNITAVSFLNHALSLNPSNKQIYTAMSQLYEQLDMRTEAINANLKAISFFPYEADFKIRLATLYYIEKNYEEALKYYNEAYKLSTDNLKIILGLAVCNKMANNTDNAIQFFEEGVKLDPINPAIYEELTMLYYNNNHLDKAFQNCETLISLSSKEVNPYILYAKICLKSMEYNKGIIFLEKEKEKFPQNGEFDFWLARLYDGLNGNENAESYYKKSLLLLDSKYEACYYYALFLNKEKRYEEAIDYLKKAILENPEFANAFNFLGYLLLETNASINEAISYIEKALKLNPDNPAFLDSMAWALFKKGKYEEALIYQEKAAASSDELIIYEHLLSIYEKLKLTDKIDRIKSKIEDLKKTEQVLR